MFEHICSNPYYNISYKCMHCHKEYELDCHTIIELLYTKNIKLCYNCYHNQLKDSLWAIAMPIKGE